MELSALGQRDDASRHEAICIAKGLKAPIICTPEELMEAKS